MPLTDPTPDGDRRSRVPWVSVLLLVAVGLGLFFAVRAKGGLEPAVLVRTQSVEASRLPIFFDLPAFAVHPRQAAAVSFGAAGFVGEVLVEPGDRVDAGQPLASLTLPRKLAKQTAVARTAVARAQAATAAVVRRLDRLVAQRLRLEDQRRSLSQSLAERGDSPSRPELATTTQRPAFKLKRADRQLQLLTTNETRLRAAEVKEKGKLLRAETALAAIGLRAAESQLTAPFEGVVKDVMVSPGRPVSPAQAVLTLLGAAVVQLEFVVPNASAMQRGGEAFVSVSNGSPMRAKVVSIEPLDQGRRIDLSLVDPGATLARVPAREFRLVREFVDAAFAVPATALLRDPQGTRVYVEAEGHARARPVDLITTDSTTAIVLDPSGALHDGARLVVELIGKRELSALVEGTPLEVRP